VDAVDVKCQCLARLSERVEDDPLLALPRCGERFPLSVKSRATPTRCVRTTTQPSIFHADISSFQIAPRSSATCCSSCIFLFASPIDYPRPQSHPSVEIFRMSVVRAQSRYSNVERHQRSRLRFCLVGPTTSRHNDLQGELVAQRGFVSHERGGSNIAHCVIIAELHMTTIVHRFVS
jgi:hypothetical protein